MSDTEKAICAGLKSCPFCGSQPEFFLVSNAHGTGASGMEAPNRGLRCSNDECPARPHTATYCTQEWKGGIGHFDVDKTDMLIQAWDSRINK